MEDIERNLDLLFKEALGNATEEVSPAVWKGVSKAIGKPSRVVFPAWLWWAGVSFAAAAAVALGVFLFNHTPQQVPDSSMVANATEPAFEELVVEEEVAPLEEQLSRSAGLSAYVPEKAKAPSVAAAPSEISSPEQLYVVEETEEEAVVAEEPEKTEKPVSEEPAHESVQTVTPVVFPTENEAKAKTGVSILAGGNLGGNVGSRSVSPSRRYSQGGDGSFTPGMSGLEDFKYGLPVSATLGVKWQFHPRWAVGTGVSFTMLPSTCSGTYTSPEGVIMDSEHIHNFQTYVGVPLNFYFTIVESKAVGFYTFAGGAVEKNIINRYTFNNGSERIRYKEKVKGVQPSVGLGIGVDFRFTKFLSLYIDPSVRYYFDCKQPQSIRTVQPVALSLDAGLRFGF